MLAMNKSKRQPSAPRRSHMRMPRISIPNWIFGTIAVLFLLVGGYLLLLTTSPIIAPHFTKPITVATLAKPEAKDNRIIIPKIGVNIPYGTNGKLALDRGAWWRYPDHGNPRRVVTSSWQPTALVSSQRLAAQWKNHHSFISISSP